MPARTTYKYQLVRTVAAALRDPEREVAARATLRERFGAASGRGFKALLAACPLEGVDLVRPRDVARDVDVVVFPPRRRTSDAGRT